MDLRVSDDLAAAGLAREVANRVQRLRKKAGLIATDPVDVWVAVSGEGAGPEAPDLLGVLGGQAEYVRELLGRLVLSAAGRPAGARLIASEAHVLGAEEARLEFELSLTWPEGAGGGATS